MRCEDSHFFVINLQFLVTKLVLLSIVSPTRSPRVHWRPFPLTRTICCRGKQLTPTGYGLRPILPSLTAGPLPLTSRGRLRPLGVSRHSASCVRSLAVLPPSASQNHLSCALEAVFVHDRPVLTPLVCAQALLRTQYPRSTLSRVRWGPFLFTGASEQT